MSGIDGNEGLVHISGELLRRAMYIARETGADKPEAVKLRETLLRLRTRATEKAVPVPVLWFGELDLEFCVSPPESVAADIEAVLGRCSGADIHTRASLLNMAATAWGRSRREDDRNRCKVVAAEAMADEAERFVMTGGSAMLAADMLGKAIAQLHGTPGAKDKRKALRHRLVDVQALIPDEMPVFSHKLDTEETCRDVEEFFIGRPLFDQFFQLSGLANSPDPDALVADARELRLGSVSIPGTARMGAKS